MKYQVRLPEGWTPDRVKRVLEHYETQSDEEAAREDEASLEASGETLMVVPSELVPVVRQLIAERAA